MDNMWKGVSDDDQKYFTSKGYAITYGELTLDGLKTIMKDNVKVKKDKIFVDLGSGEGNVVLNAIKLYPQLQMGIGIELSKSRHERAIEKLENSKLKDKNKVKFFNEDILDDGWDYSDFDIIYISNLCFPEDVNVKIAEKIKKECKKGTQIFCSKPLPPIDGGNKISEFNVCQTWTQESKINYYKI